MSQRKFRYFAIFGAMRSGSNLLEQSLNQFSGLRCYGELFNPAFVGGPKQKHSFGFTTATREKDPEGLIAAMIAQTKGALPGFRIFDGHDPRIIDKALRDPDCAKILLWRDPLESYVSLKIARKTDQWLLRNAPHRKQALVRFDAEEFESFAQAQTAYYDGLRRRLQTSGQTAFELVYPAQRSLDVLNGLAAYLGVDERLKSLKETLRRQNPEPLPEKVSNPQDLQAYLSRNAGQPTSFGASDPKLRANIPRMVTCLSRPVLFAPVPGGPNEEVLRWMHALDAGPPPAGSFAEAVAAGDILHSGHSQRTLFEWMASNPGVVVMTAVRHPLARAYDAFMRKIFATGPGCYDVIRKQLIADFDIALPDEAALESGAYKVKHHRAAFHGFLKFLKANLAQQTSIRIDGLWASQMSFLRGFNTAVPVTLVAKEGKMDPAFRYVETLLDVARPALGPPIRPQYRFSLDEIYTRQTENLARKAYAADYTRFGFDDYQAALEA